MIDEADECLRQGELRGFRSHEASCLEMNTEYIRIEFRVSGFLFFWSQKEGQLVREEVGAISARRPTTALTDSEFHYP